VASKNIVLIKPIPPVPEVLFWNRRRRRSKWYHLTLDHISHLKKQLSTRMWANAQRDGRPAAYRWRPLFNAAKFG